jgi:hypothetical protein
VELSDKIVEVIKKDTCFQYEHSLVARSVAIFIALTESDSNRRDNARGNDVPMISRMKKWCLKLRYATSFGNTKVKIRCRKS